MQGYCGYSDDLMCEAGPYARIATGLCMAWTAAGTFLASPAVLWSLAFIAALGAALPWHPFDLIYNHGLRRLTRTRALPRHGAPRRFACGVATAWLIATGGAFYGGWPLIGKALGYSMAIAAAFPTFVDFCIPSYVYRKVFGGPREPA